ncbi:hypothetical protein JOM56_015473 [Amanita muscaria]
MYTFVAGVQAQLVQMTYTQTDKSDDSKCARSENHTAKAVVGTMSLAEEDLVEPSTRRKVTIDRCLSRNVPHAFVLFKAAVGHACNVAEASGTFQWRQRNYWNIVSFKHEMATCIEGSAAYMDGPSQQHPLRLEPINKISYTSVVKLALRKLAITIIFDNSEPQRVQLHRRLEQCLCCQAKLAGCEWNQELENQGEAPTTDKRNAVGAQKQQPATGGVFFWQQQPSGDFFRSTTQQQQPNLPLLCLVLQQEPRPHHKALELLLQGPLDNLLDCLQVRLERLRLEVLDLEQVRSVQVLLAGRQYSATFITLLILCMAALKYPQRRHMGKAVCENPDPVIHHAAAQLTRITQRLMRSIQHPHLLKTALRSSFITPEEEQLRGKLQDIDEKTKTTLIEVWALLVAIVASTRRQAREWDWRVGSGGQGRCCPDCSADWPYVSDENTKKDVAWFGHHYYGTIEEVLSRQQQ